MSRQQKKLKKKLKGRLFRLNQKYFKSSDDYVSLDIICGKTIHTPSRAMLETDDDGKIKQCSIEIYLDEASSYKFANTLLAHEFGHIMTYFIFWDSQWLINMFDFLGKIGTGAIAKTDSSDYSVGETMADYFGYLEDTRFISGIVDQKELAEAYAVSFPAGKVYFDQLDQTKNAHWTGFRRKLTINYEKLERIKINHIIKKFVYDVTEQKIV